MAQNKVQFSAYSIQKELIQKELMEKDTMV